MTPQQMIDMVLPNKSAVAKEKGHAFAPSNIALCKYWGKRDQSLNLPMTSSLSIALPTKGTWTDIGLAKQQDSIVLNGQVVPRDSDFYKRTVAYCDLFRPTTDIYYRIDTKNNIPTAAGLASSASGYGALIKALNDLWQWQLDDTALSILARLGSGSACRSLWNGFVEWQRGERGDGLDSFAKPLAMTWPGLCIGLLIFSEKEKAIGSREAMNSTVNTSSSYSQWPARVACDLEVAKRALVLRDFEGLGRVVESNALAMHQTMLDAVPSIDYCLKKTWHARDQVARLRAQGVAVYFTQDAGPNIKLLFEKKDWLVIKAAFSAVELVEVF
jgi:diphosphomevalonate decarboxylase